MTDISAENCTVLEPNPQGTIIVQRIYQRLYEGYGDSDRVMGFYKSFSRLDLIMIGEYLESKDFGSHFDMTFLLSLFGEETAIEVLSKDLRLLDSAR